MCCTITSTCKMSMVSNFSVNFLISDLFKNLFPQMFHVSVILALFLSMITFFFSKLIIFVACSLKEVQDFFIQSSPQFKVHLFSILPNVHIIDFEYPQEHVHLNLLLKIFLDHFHIHVIF